MPTNLWYSKLFDQVAETKLLSITAYAEIKNILDRVIFFTVLKYNQKILNWKFIKV